MKDSGNKKTLLDILRSNIYVAMFFVILMLSLLFLFIWLFFIIDGPIPNGQGLDKSNWLNFIGSYLGFIGTVLLGTIALWQNYRFKSENDKAQGRLETISNKANDISEQSYYLRKINSDLT